LAIPNIHVLHAHYNIVVIAQKCAVEIDYKLGVALMHDMKFPYDTAAHFFLGFDVDDLRVCP
jgi:hypothetical protein